MFYIEGPRNAHSVEYLSCTQASSWKKKAHTLQVCVKSGEHIQCWLMYVVSGRRGGNNENQIQLVAEGSCLWWLCARLGRAVLSQLLLSEIDPSCPQKYSNIVIINSSHFCYVVSHQQGWTHHALQDQQKCTHNTSKRIYEHYVVFLSHHTHTPAHMWVHWRNVIGWEEDRFWNHLLWYCL